MSPNIWNIRVFAENEDKYPAYIISTSGKVVIKEDFKRGDNYLNLDSLYSGVYVICVQIDESRYPKLIVVE